MRAGFRGWSKGVSALVLAVLAPAVVGIAARGVPADDEPAPKGEAAAAADSKAVPSKSKSKPDYLDKMIQEAWEASSVKSSRVAADAEFLRRIYLDMLGRIPNVQEATSFLGAKDPNKRVKLVEYLLNHPDYAKNFATIWTVTLIGRGNQGRMVDRGALTGWLRQQFSANRSWKDIAFDLIDAKGSNKENGAANFVLSHLEFDKAPLTSISTRVFLGLQIQCTQCHDHPSNDWKQTHFWGINAFLKGIRSRDVNKPNATGADVYDHTEVFDEPTDSFASFDRRNGLVGIAFPTFLDGRKISQGTDVDRRAELAKFITQDNADFDRAFVNRMWAHFFGRGFVHPVDDFGAHNPPSNPELLDKLAADFKASGYDIKALIRWIATSQAYNLTSMSTPQNDKDDTLYSHMALKPMTPEQLFESLITATAAHKAGGGGDDNKRRDEWMKQFLFTFGNDEGEESTSFQGTIPQALMMMNGELMAKAVGGQPGSFLASVLEQAQLQRRQPIDQFIINHLFLAALSRLPSSAELNKAREFLRFNPEPNPIPVMEDLFWALLNSNEFVLNH